MNPAGKIALITGGTRGIGEALARQLAAEGADVALAARRIDDHARAVSGEIKGLGRRCELIQADFAKPVDCERTVRETEARLGPVDIMVHAAGGPVNGGLMEITPEAWQAAFDVHVHAVFYLARAVVPAMRRKKEGAILLVSSTAGIRGIITNVAYQAAKGALPQLTRALAREFAADNIRVNCVAPGVIRTDFHAAMSEEQKRLNLEQRIPLRREGTPAQVAELMMTLLKNDYITGETMTIDGGLTMRIA